MQRSSPAWIAVGTLVAGFALTACPERSPDAGEPEQCAASLRLSIDQLQLPHSREVDILFVIDDSESTADEQAKLSAAAGALFAQLDAVGADYRIGFTTTDNGNPWCDGATAEGGKLVMSSCTSRLVGFGPCDDLCGLDEAALALSPTTTDVDPEAKPRPWMERISGRSNLPEGSDPVAAFQCFAPQGVDGCRFESPLESMYLALIRARTSSEASYGFLRPDAALAVVVVTDAVDCSTNKTWSEIFDDTGDKAFWSDPSATEPSSAVCWNAGVECSGDPSGYDGCEPADKAIDGSATVASDAVLHPTARYLGLLEELEEEKQQINVQQEVLFTLIAGVEGGGEDWSVDYADAADPDFQLAYGIGPGCVGDDGEVALPPVRLRAVAEQLGGGALYSACASDYSAALGGLGAQIAGQLGPSCFSKCAYDTEPETARVDPSCTLEHYLPGPSGEAVAIPECLRAEDGSYLSDAQTDTGYAIPDGADLCFATLVDPDGSVTADARDDMSAACVEDNYNLEAVLARRPGYSLPSGSTVTIDCALSDCPETDCPGIGG